jgi:hypothetical protein
VSCGLGDQLRVPHRIEDMQQCYFSDSGGKIKEQLLGKVWDFMENLQINQQQAQGMN